MDCILLGGISCLILTILIMTIGIKQETLVEVREKGNLTIDLFPITNLGKTDGHSLRSRVLGRD